MCAPSSYRSVRTTRITRCSSGRPGSFSSNSVYDRARNRLYAARLGCGGYKHKEERQTIRRLAEVEARAAGLLEELLRVAKYAVDNP